MKKLSLLSALILLALTVACGSGNGGGGTPNPPPTGNFSNSSLNGSYAYQVNGYDYASLTTGVLFREAGVFTADGNGHITSGTDDLNEGGQIFSDPSTGTYSVSNDGTGSIQLNFSGGAGVTFAITMASSSKVYLAAAGTSNGPASGTGIAEVQTAGALATTPSGTYVFRNHTVSSVQGSAASVGAFTVTGGAISGNSDVMRGGAQSSVALNGTFNAPDASGRGTGTFTDSGSVTSPFAYYIVDANNIRFFFTNTTAPGLGRAERQTGAPFTDASFSGNYAFGSQGDDNLALGATMTVGRLTAGGDGTITAGALDSVIDGNSSANTSFTGSYSVAGNGRATLMLNPSGGGIQEIAWMVSPSRALFLTDDASRVEDGSMDQQQVSTFSNSTMNGQFAVVTDGFASTDAFNRNRLGTLNWNGTGTLSLNEFLNVDGTITTPGVITGTYAVSANGRATGSIDTLSNNLVFYLISGNDGYLLQNDTGTEINGMISKQP